MNFCQANIRIEFFAGDLFLANYQRIYILFSNFIQIYIHMEIAANSLMSVVILIHLYILWFEMFAWTTRGPKVFKGFPKELFPKTVSMAANQGLYNGFLAAGLIWSFFIQDPIWSKNVALFFLSCVAVAGIYGAFTASKKIFWVQALPALLAILFFMI